MLVSKQAQINHSLINCHAEGLDSIVIAPRRHFYRGMIRIFIARHEHTLWKNKVVASYPMSIGFHSHHCAITMIPLFGTIHNVFTTDEPGLKSGHTMFGYRWDSKISGKGKGKGFARMLGVRTVKVIYSPLVEVTLLKSYQEHSVFVPQGETAAWMIIEGEEDALYNPVTYSNDPTLDSFDFSKLYQPMTQVRLQWDLNLLSVKGINL